MRKLTEKQKELLEQRSEEFNFEFSRNSKHNYSSLKLTVSIQIHNSLLLQGRLECRDIIVEQLKRLKTHSAEEIEEQIQRLKEIKEAK